jgi:zinc protease
MEDPESYFSYKTTEFLANGNPRALNTPLVEDYDGIDLKRVEEIYRERFAGADDFNFYFVGSFTLDEIRPYIETYIASLPAKGVKENYKDITSTYPAGKTEKVFNKGVDAKANVRFVFNKTDVKYDRKTAFDFTIFSSILSTRLLKSLREEMGGTYSVGARGTAYWQPKDEAEFIIAFSSNVEKYTELYERAISDLKELYANGPTDEEVAAKKEQNALQWVEQTKTNRYWLSILSGAVNQGLSPDEALKTKDYIDGLNAGDVKAAGQKYLDPEEWIRIICLPEKK